VSPRNECDPFYYLDPGFACADAAKCVKSFTWPPNTPTAMTCLLAGMTCSEVMPMTGNSCNARVVPEYCVPDALCNGGCTIASTGLRSCVHSGSIAAIKCSMAAIDTGTICTNEYSSLVDLSELVKANPATMCDDISIADDSTAPMFAFNSPWTAMGGTGAMTPGPTVTPTTSATVNCQYQLVFTPPSVIAFDPQYYGVVDVPLSNGRHDLLPIEIDLAVGQCPSSGSAVTCSLVNISGSDTLHNCATAP
jgi:hypothetical protein